MKKFSPGWWQSLPPERVGRETELIVEALFKKWNARQDVAYHRMPDAHAARGRLKAQPADYVYRCGKYAGFLEVKAVKHATRLPAARLTQLPTLHKWSLAGSTDIVLIHHHTTGEWRAIYAAELPTDVTSWDLSGHPTFPTAEAALISTGVF